MQLLALIQAKDPFVLQNALGKDKVVFMGDAFMPDYGADGRIDQATREAQDADAVILFLGTSAINPHTLSTVHTLQTLALSLL